MVLGVSCWIAQKFDVNITFIRVLFIICFLTFGIGLGIYLISWFLKLILK